LYGRRAKNQLPVKIIVYIAFYMVLQ